MPNVKIYDFNGKVVGDIDLSEEIFGAEDRSYLYGEVVRGQLLARRRGTASTLDRGEVQGSSKKLFKQKGTGRARRGNAKSPLLRHGGTAFGPKPKDWSIRIPKKAKRIALMSALSARVREDSLLVLDSADMQTPKTGFVAGFLEKIGTRSALIVDVKNKALSLSCRNLATTKFLDVEGLNLFDILKYNRVIVTREAVGLIERKLQS